MNTSSQSKIILLSILLAAIFSVGILWWVFKPTNEGEMRFAKVQRGDLIQRVTVPGSIEPAKRTLISAQYSGYIQKLFVKVGDKVKMNDPIVIVTQSLQNLEKAYPLRSPMNGTVVQVDRTEGEYVKDMGGVGEGVIARIDDISKLYVAAEAPEVDSAKMKVGMETVIRVSAVSNNTYRGIVREIALAARMGEGWRSRQATFDLRVEILDIDDNLRPGMSAVVDVVTNRYPNVLYLPIEYVYQDGEKYFVMDRRGKRRYIEVGHQTEMAYEIVKGLKEGEEVQLVDFLKIIESGS